MKKSELRQIIREEIQKLNETDTKQIKTLKKMNKERGLRIQKFKDVLRKDGIDVT